MAEAQIGEDNIDNVKFFVREETALVDFHRDKKTGGKCHLKKNLIESVVKIVIIDAADLDDDTGTANRYKLGEIWYNIQPLADIHEIKQNLAEDLSSLNVPPRSFSDFNLGCMSLLKDGGISLPRHVSESENSIHSTLENSMLLYYLASLFVDYLYEYTKNMEMKKSLKRQKEHLQNVCNVFENALKVNGWSVPDLVTTREKFDYFQARLSDLADQYIKGHVTEYRYASTNCEWSGSELLHQHKQLVINYEIVSEIEYAITSLRDVFGTIKEERMVDSNLYSELY